MLAKPLAITSQGVEGTDNLLSNEVAISGNVIYEVMGTSEKQKGGEFSNPKVFSIPFTRKEKPGIKYP